MPEPIDVSDCPAGSVSDKGHYLCSLTGQHSHILKCESGVGSINIGPASMGKKVDLHVAHDEAINWSSFDPFCTPSGTPWPRFIDYTGNDTGFIFWSQNREIEDMLWAPSFTDARRVDASAAKIHCLKIQLQDVSGHLELAIPASGHLHLFGDLSRFTLFGEHLPNVLLLHPALHRYHHGKLYTLPELGLLYNVPELNLCGVPLNQPISLKGIERFGALERIALWGSFAHWEELAKLPNLKALEVRFAPDMSGFPSLNSWPELDSFIAYNVEATAGKLLRTQVKERAKIRPWKNFISVSQLRKAEWWQNKYGRPFAGWRGRIAKSANAAYDTALEAFEEATNAAAVKAAIIAFTDHFNDMENIDTVEREDISEAVWQFSQLASVIELGVTEEQALHWFDEIRDY